LPMKNLSLNFLPNQNFPCPRNHPYLLVMSCVGRVVPGEGEN
jgi:hypothetical protein